MSARTDPINFHAMLRISVRAAIWAIPSVFVARCVVLLLLWHNLNDVRQVLLRVAGFGLGTTSVLCLGFGLGVVPARWCLSRFPRFAGVTLALAAGAAGQAVALGLLDLLATSAARHDFDLPLCNVPWCLGFTALCCLVGAFPCAGILTVKWRLICAAGLAMALVQSQGTGYSEGWFAGATEGAVLAACLARAHARRLRRLEPGSRGFPGNRLLRLLTPANVTLAALSMVLGIGVARMFAHQLVEEEIARLEPYMRRILTTKRIADPVYARWMIEIRAREAEVRELVRHYPKHLFALHSAFAVPWPLGNPHRQLGEMMADASEIARHVLADSGENTELDTRCRHRSICALLALVKGFRVPASIDRCSDGLEHNNLTVYRGGCPIFVISTVAASDPAGRLAATWEEAQLGPIGLFDVKGSAGTGPTHVQWLEDSGRWIFKIGDWFYSVGAPSFPLARRALVRLVRGPALAPGDDLVDADVLEADWGERRWMIAMGPEASPQHLPEAAFRQARAWFAGGLHAYFGDVHTHCSATLGGMLPAEETAAIALGQFSQFFTITEHFAQGANEPAERFIHQWAPDCSFIPGEEFILGTSHLTALGLSGWIPVPWFMFTAPPASFVARIKNAGALPVFAHAYLPGQRDAPYLLENWKALGFAAIETSGYIEASEYEHTSRPSAPMLGGSDSHDGTFGGGRRTLVLAPDNRRESLLAAIREDRVLSINLQQPWLGRGNPAMRAALYLMLTTPGMLAKELERNWHLGRLPHRSAADILATPFTK